MVDCTARSDLFYRLGLFRAQAQELLQQRRPLGFFGGVPASGSTADVKPVLQVADLRLVNTQSRNNERYRLLLSDGVHLHQGMLAPQKNDLVRTHSLQNGSIVQLSQFVRKVIQGHTIIIIIGLNVILDKCDPIGELRQFERPGTNTSSALVARFSAQVHSTVGQLGSSFSLKAFSLLKEINQTEVSSHTIHWDQPEGDFRSGLPTISVAKPNVIGGMYPNQPKVDCSPDSPSCGGFIASNPEMGRSNANAPNAHLVGGGIS